MSRAVDIVCLALAAAMWLSASASAQVPPSAAEVATYDGLHKAAHDGDVAAIRVLVSQGADLEARDGHGRTAVHIAAFASQEAALAALAEVGADMNALENDAYDAVTIAAVADDEEMLDAALKAGNSAANITSRYVGTALIAAAHLGHHRAVKRLIAAGAPLDHVNNLGWTALIEAVVLGDGGPDHQECVRLLLEGGANAAIADRSGRTPLHLAKERGFEEIARLLESAP